MYCFILMSKILATTFSPRLFSNRVPDVVGDHSTDSEESTESGEENNLLEEMNISKPVGIPEITRSMLFFMLKKDVKTFSDKNDPRIREVIKQLNAIKANMDVFQTFIFMVNDIMKVIYPKYHWNFKGKIIQPNVSYREFDKSSVFAYRLCCFTENYNDSTVTFYPYFRICYQKNMEKSVRNIEAYCKELKKQGAHMLFFIENKVVISEGFLDNKLNKNVKYGWDDIYRIKGLVLKNEKEYRLINVKFSVEDPEKYHLYDFINDLAPITIKDIRNLTIVAIIYKRG